MNQIDTALRDDLDAKLTSNLNVFTEQHAAAEKAEDSIGWSRCKISVFGERMSGKTSLIRGLLGRRFIANYVPTESLHAASITLSYNRNWRLSEADTFRNRHYAKIYFTSRKMKLPPKYQERIGMTIVDYGSRYVRHSIHQLLISSYGVNVFVFDMQAMLANPTQHAQRMHHWMQSLNLQLDDATVVVVGTRRDLISDLKQHEEIDSVVSKLTEAKNIKLIAPHGLSFFAVDNLSANGVSQVQKAIAATVVGEDYGNVAIPVRWITCLEKIKVLPSSLLALTRVEEICSRAALTSADEMKRMLSFFHDAGELIYLHTTENLASFVATKPSTLLDPITCIVDRELVEKVDRKAVHAAGLAKEFAQLRESAIVSMDLLHFFWKKQHASFLLDVCLHLLHLSPLARGGHDHLFLVPKMIPPAKENIARTMRGLRAEFRYRFLPDGIFERMICLYIDHCSRDEGLEEPVIKRDFCRVHFNKDTVVEFERHQDTIVLIVFDESKAQMCLSATQSILRQVNELAMNGKLGFSLYVEHEKEMISVQTAKRNRDCVWYRSSRSRVPASLRMSMFLS